MVQSRTRSVFLTCSHGLLLIAAAIAAISVCASAEVRPNSLFSDNAVLQRGLPVPVWGTASDGETVTVTLQGQRVTTTSRNGKWMLRLKPLEAGGPYTMTIEGSNRVELRNVMVGDVWVCSGQSNMEFTLDRCAEKDEATAASADPMLRLLKVPRKPADQPIDDAGVQWVAAGPETTGSFSGVGYFFGRDLRKALGVPVGLIDAAYGGTRIQTWMGERSLRPTEAMNDVLEKWPEWARDRNRVCVLFNGMICPLIPYAIRGVIWYQGEGNTGEACAYRTWFPDMIREWREDWGQGEFPFLFVQLAPYLKIETEPGESHWAELRESQLLTSLNCPNTAMAVITDYGDQEDIHPQHKEPVGGRLALAARALAYEEKIVFGGPVYRSVTFRGNRAVLDFDSVGGGLLARDGELSGFTIAGEDRKFHNASAGIVGSRVVVHSPNVARPVAVRYGWANYPVVNLFNLEGLPASPFRTDDFPMITRPRDKK